MENNMNIDPPPQIPRIDFTHLEYPENHGSSAWESTRKQVMTALACTGCFDAMYDGVSKGVKDDLFGTVVNEIFGLPLDVKMNNKSDVPFHGYIGQLPNMAYESMRVQNVTSLQSVHNFTKLLWPQHNKESLCNTLWRFGTHVKKLEKMVERMILESLGIDQYYDSHVDSLDYGLNLSEYGVPLDQENMVALATHVDHNFITIISQDQVDGLEVLSKNGRQWIPVSFKENSFIVMTGEAFGAWSNGRVIPCLHRVRIPTNKKRYSALLGSRPGKNLIVQAPKELVDDEHPQLFKPYNYDEFFKFRYSSQGRKSNTPLKDFCAAHEGVFVPWYEHASLLAK